MARVRALRWQQKLAAEPRRLLTIQFILAEIADGLAAAVKFRSEAVQTIERLTTSAWVEVLPASGELFAAAFALYRERQDKSWGMTDCTSFVAMREYGINEALTVDDDFQQAGFRALMLEVDE
ncbi:MAG: hypothetical protein WKF84_08290 [Pyrinomonadaceae bacterium]